MKPALIIELHVSWPSGHGRTYFRKWRWSQADCVEVTHHADEACRYLGAPEADAMAAKLRLCGHPYARVVRADRTFAEMYAEGVTL